jgi:hypothetical protein
MVTNCKTCCLMLNLFELFNLLTDVGVPYTSCIFEPGSYKGLVCDGFDVLIARAKVSSNKMEGLNGASPGRFSLPFPVQVLLDCYP